MKIEVWKNYGCLNIIVFLTWGFNISISIVKYSYEISNTHISKRREKNALDLKVNWTRKTGQNKQIKKKTNVAVT
jgi:hypothetical protein